MSELNRYGRRTISLRGPKGDIIDIVQAITEINARYAKLEALKSKPAYQWDMRVATSSIPPQQLQAIFRQRIDQSDIDRRLDVVRFFIESKRLRAAEEELIRIMRDFPDEPAMKSQLFSIIQEQGNRLIEEAIEREAVGQVRYARDLYERFPMQAVSGVTREKVKIRVEQLQETDKQIAELIKNLRADVGGLRDDQSDKLTEILAEIEKNLTLSTLPRLSDYSRLLGGQVPRENRVALAIAGWLMGPGSGEQNLVIATSLIQVRGMVAEYLRTTDVTRRTQILEQLKALEGSQIEYVARLLPQMKPAVDWPEGSADPGVAGRYRIGEMAGDGEVQRLVESPDYLVQLPPEYDPLREYPCLLVLAPPRADPNAELSWWAGDVDPAKKMPSGHAMRNGYIVISPAWGRDGQRAYEYTPREHHAVLSSLRHAMRRASIDSDRVFIAGHGEGATAAWDIALSHPELFAGMVSINGEPSKTLRHYFPNAVNIPLYFVMGEATGPEPPLVRMGSVLDRYMEFRNDATVVMYRGRGRESFFEEVPEIFDWLNASLHVRKPVPQKLDCVTMREGDQFFWWLELGPLSQAVSLNPILWEQSERFREGIIDARLGGENQIRITKMPADNATIWLGPEMGIDLSAPITVNVGSRPQTFRFEGGLETLLEDVRQRADRKRPFWFKIAVP